MKVRELIKTLERDGWRHVYAHEEVRA